MHPAGFFCTNLKKAVDNSPFSWYNNTRRQGRHRLWGISSAGSPRYSVTHPHTIQLNKNFLLDYFFARSYHFWQIMGV